MPGQLPGLRQPAALNECRGGLDATLGVPFRFPWRIRVSTVSLIAAETPGNSADTAQQPSDNLPSGRRATPMIGRGVELSDHLRIGARVQRRAATI